MSPSPTWQAGDVTAVLAGPVVEIEIHRPPANFFDAALLGDLVAAVAWAADAGGRAGVLCSEGKHFCAGLDFGASGRPAPEALDRLYALGRELVAAPIPLVAAVQGSAVGGGLGLRLRLRLLPPLRSGRLRGLLRSPRCRRRRHRLAPGRLGLRRQLFLALSGRGEN